MSVHELTCIGCPMGCQITVEFDKEKEEVYSVEGNTCAIGDKYARNEVLHPERAVAALQQRKLKHQKPNILLVMPVCGTISTTLCLFVRSASGTYQRVFGHF